MAASLQKKNPAGSGKARPATPAPGNPGWAWLQAAIIILAGWWVFSPAFHGDWLWDDNFEITQNGTLRNPAGLWKIWFSTANLDYFPLKSTLQWLLWRLWQNQPLGYHLTSVGLHLLGALVFGHLLRKLGLRLAWLGGLLFALHPVVVESVAWAAELKNTLSLPFLLLALCAWLDYDEKKRRGDYLRALLLFLAAMLCKSSVVMFPVVLLLHAWWKRGRITWKDLQASAAFFAVSAVLGLVTVWFQQSRAIGAENIPLGGFLSRLAGSGLALAFYFYKSVFPAGLLPTYPRWTVDPPALVQFLPWPAMGIGFGVLWCKRATWGRHVLLGGGFFVVNLAPVLGFIRISYMHVTWVADHFVYLPLVGLLGLALAGVETVVAGTSAFRRSAVIGGLLLVAGLFAFQSHRYARVFRNEEALWAYTLQRNPGSWLAHNNLGYALYLAGQVPAAISHYEAALRIKPRSAEVHDNLGNALFDTGRIVEAGEQYQEELRIKPRSVTAHNNLGGAFFQMNRLAEAKEQYEEVLRLNPAYAEAQNNLGSVLFRLGRIEEARKHYEQALRIKPHYAEAHGNLGNTLLKLGRRQEAIDRFEQALRINPGYTMARDSLIRLRALRPAAKPGN